ncbi:GGDEF domain-containing protein [Pseudomarimonas arenosa]|uniref:diguanylate cyclase n=1 Tax=Pseudomarimonas arenosa TaxID=2774145 RepID=A0AAW3ZMX2_9GAMM|nr:GGDEF domain-containing protein [Pseudomarimonas arenosa]MBD8525731.1 GGDEF domain-containing protein [Pseudomarimonas arenosa]
MSRLRADYALASVAFLGAVATAAILPFAVYRFWNREYWQGAVDLLVVLAVVLPVIYAWRSGRNRGAFLLILLGGWIGSLAITQMVGLAGHYWVYGYLVMTFVLAELSVAVIAGLSLVLVTCILGAGMETPIMRFSYAATAVLVVFLSAIGAFQVAKQRRLLERLASTDPLTGALNRRQMAVDLAHEVNVAGRGGALPAVLILDLDHFKQINDQFGHEMGDRVLVEFSNVVRELVRRSDRLYRIGGEEFLLLLPAMDEAGTRVVAQKVVQQVADRLRVPDRAVTTSVGAALWSRGELVSSWLARADSAVYQAKQAGRNRAVLAAAPQHRPLPAQQNQGRRLSDDVT